MTRNGYIYSNGSYWTDKHIKWLQRIKFEEEILQETLNEYMIEYFRLVDRVDILDKRIDEIANKDVYVEKVNRLCCLRRIKIHTALSFIVETSDFTRFSKGNIYVAFLGLILGDDSSGANDINWV